MGVARWFRDARLSLAMLGPLGGMRSIPAVPAQTIRDPWPGNAANGERLVQGSATHDGVTRVLNYARWSSPGWPDSFRDWLQGFEWLRDLRELGSDSARAKARAMVATWLGQPIGETPLQDPAVTGTRLASWLSHYDFFAASADDSFRRSLMTRIALESRTIMALVPTGRHDWTSLRALRGLLATAIALPDQEAVLARFMKLIDPDLEAQILGDGSHASRSPEAQFLVLRELADMRLMLQAARIPLPTTLAAALDRMVPVLRAFRHNDGRLALFNGTKYHDPSLIDLVIARAMPRGHVLARGLPDARFVRAAVGTSVLFVDGGAPPPPPFDMLAHGGLMSMEFSSARSQIVVNCGASTLSAWERALRDAPAHSVLSIPACPPVVWNAHGQVDVRPDVTCKHEVSGAGQLIELASDCYRPVGVQTYHRRLYLGAEGTDLRGEDRLDSTGPLPDFVLRFHLHPDVKVELEDTDILLRTADEMWRFRSDGYSSIEESVYFGGPRPVPTLQIVVRPSDVTPEEEENNPPEETVADDSVTEDESETTVIEEDVVSASEPENMPDSAPEATDHETVQAESSLASEPDSETDHILAESEATATGPGNTEDTVMVEQMPPVSSQPPAVANSIRWAFTRLDD